MTKRLLRKTARVLGKWWTEVVSLPDDRRESALRVAARDYPRFPPF